jgi:LemA protein
MMFGAAMIIGLVLAGAILLGLLWAVASYNGLAAARTKCREAFEQVLLRLRQRNELIPAVIDTARAHMRHERETLEGLNVAVQTAGGLLETLVSRPVEEPGMRKLQEAEGGVSNALGRFLAISEAYPELRASANMVRISAALGVAENEVSIAKQAYNDQSQRYAALQATLPQSLLSKALGFPDAPFFDTATELPRPSQAGPPRMGITRA